MIKLKREVEIELDLQGPEIAREFSSQDAIAQASFFEGLASRLLVACADGFNLDKQYLWIAQQLAENDSEGKRMVLQIAGFIQSEEAESK